MSDLRCKALKQNGEPCRAFAMNSSDYCIVHSGESQTAGFGGANTGGGRPPGRPPKLTTDSVARIVAAAREGNTRRLCAAAGGINEATLYRWIELGETQDRGRYKEFREKLREAELEAERRLVQAWVSQAPEDWRAARDFLARRYPDEWAPREKREISGPDGAPLEVNFLDLLREAAEK